MHGTVLLLASDRSLPVEVDVLRANGLIVYHCHEPAHALTRFHHIAPDVIVAVLSGHESPSLLPELRRLAGHATSIIVASVPEQREAARKGGADSFLLKSAPPPDLLYEIHRALILRRSGRRLPWNWWTSIALVGIRGLAAFGCVRATPRDDLPETRAAARPRHARLARS